MKPPDVLRHARLKVTGDGFTGIKVNRYPGGEGPTLLPGAMRERENYRAITCASIAPRYSSSEIW
jgi:hypothetical protein